MAESKGTPPNGTAGTEAGTTEQHLPQDADLYETLFAEHPDCLVLVIEGKIALASDRCLELTGYSADEAIGMDLSDLVIPEEQTRITERNQELLEQGREYLAEGRDNNASCRPLQARVLRREACRYLCHA